MKFREWFDDYPKLEVLPWSKKKERLGNELKDTQTCGQILKSPFAKPEKGAEPIKLPTQSAEDSPRGLGELGMKEVGRSTFVRHPIPAGETPTISKGIPVGGMKGQFEAVHTQIKRLHTRKKSHES